MKQLSIYTVFNIFNETVRALCTEFEVEFDKKNVEQSFESLRQKLETLQTEKANFNAWDTLYQLFKNLVKEQVGHVFVQENKDMKLAMISLLGFPNGTKNNKTTRAILYTSPHKNGTVLFNLWDGKVVCSFLQKSVTFSYFEYKSFAAKLKATHQYGSKIEIVTVPLGIEVEIAYHQGNWNMCTRNVLRINDSALIGETPLMDKLTLMLDNLGVSLHELDKEASYTFHISSEEYSAVPCQERLFLVSAFKYGSNQLDNSPLASVPRLQTHKMYSCPKSSDVRLWLSEFNAVTPIYSLVFKFTTRDQQDKTVNHSHQFEVLSSLGDLIETVRENGADAETQEKNFETYRQTYPQEPYVRWYQTKFLKPVAQ